MKSMCNIFYVLLEFLEGQEKYRIQKKIILPHDIYMFSYQGCGTGVDSSPE